MRSIKSTKEYDMAVCSQKVSSFLKRAAVVAVGVAAVFAAGGARAEVQWTTGSWKTSGFTPAANNIILGRLPDSNEDKYTPLTDGAASAGATATGAHGNTAQIDSYTSLSFTFETPMIVREVRFYATWGDGGRDQISVSSVTAKTASSADPITLSPGSVTYQTTTFANYAYLADSDGAVLSGGVTSLTINFGAQEYGYVGYPEIEVVGERDFSTPFLIVSGNPLVGGTVDPSYGMHLMSEGTVSACSVWTNENQSIAWKCAGWKLYRVNTDGSCTFDPSVPNATGTGTSFDYEKPDSSVGWKLVWQWSPTYRVQVTAGDGGTAAIVGSTEYFAAGATATATAEPSAADGSVFWTGDLQVGLAPTNRTVSFPVSAATVIKANFTGITSVANSSELTAALDAAAPLIAVEAGDYQLSSERTLSSGVFIQGVTGNPADVTIRAASGKRRVFRLNHADARVRGLTLVGTGGSADGVVYLDKGALENCRVTGGCVGRNTYWGAGVCNYGGTVRRCTIDGNTAAGNIFAGLGFCQKAGLTEFCVVTNNTYSSWHGAAGHPCPAGAYVSGGTVRGTLFAFNSPGKATESTSELSNGFVLHLVGAVTVDGCAIVDNTVNYNVGLLPTAAIFLVKSGYDVPKIVNTIVVNNRDSENADLALAGEKTASYSLLPSSLSVTSGTNNVFEASNTYVWTNGEFRLNAGSAAVDALQPSDDVAGIDLYGRTRVVGTGMDIGPAELPASASEDPEVSIKTDSLSVILPTTSVFTLKLVGFPAGEKTYAWTVDGVAAGTEETLSVTWSAADVGVRTVGVTVTSGEAAASARVVVDVLSKDIYLDAASAHPVYPYASKETAATNWADVLPLIVSGGSLTIRPGTYDLENELVLLMPYRLLGDGPRDAIVLRRDRTGRLATFNHSEALVDGITFTGGFGLGGGTVYLGNGRLQNCNVFDGECVRQNCGGCLYVAKGTVSGCTIGNTTKGTETDAGPIWSGLGLHLAGGLVENCLITNVVGLGMHRAEGHAQGCAVHMTGGTLRNCLVAHNRCTDGTEGTNRLFAAGVYQSGGKIQNCTITANEAGSGPGGYCRNGGGTMVNTIVADNVNNDTEGVYGDADVGGTGAQAMTYCLTNSPCFRNPSAGDFRLRGNSPAVDAGDWTQLGATKAAVKAMADLAGASRLSGFNVDIGAYEYPAIGFTLIVR